MYIGSKEIIGSFQWMVRKKKKKTQVGSAQSRGEADGLSATKEPPPLGSGYLKALESQMGCW